MNREAKSNNGIKDTVSKLFILRDSCRGTCITQIENPNIIWYEGASVLLQQVIDKLKSARHIIDSGDKDADRNFCHNVKETVSKLIVLKRSWIVTRSEESDENAIWFEGAESIICEVIDQLQKTLQKTEPQPVVEAAEEHSQSEVAEAAKDPDTVASPEENNTNDDDTVKQKSKPQEDDSKMVAKKDDDTDNDSQVKQKSKA